MCWRARSGSRCLGVCTVRAQCLAAYRACQPHAPQHACAIGPSSSGVLKIAAPYRGPPTSNDVHTAAAQLPRPACTKAIATRQTARPLCTAGVGEERCVWVCHAGPPAMHSPLLPTCPAAVAPHLLHCRSACRHAKAQRPYRSALRSACAGAAARGAARACSAGGRRPRATAPLFKSEHTPAAARGHQAWRQAHRDHVTHGPVR